jgi:3-phenylpropionate/cinnamic acid dioxygenase small subunit
MSSQRINEVVNFLNLEADMLDQGEFDNWLTLWHPDGRYIVPIDPHTDDFENTLNFAFDDDAMRRRRVQRLYSGESISTTPRARTIRMLARHRILVDTPERLEVRCAQSLWEYRKGKSQHYVADLHYRLLPQATGFLIESKVVRMLNSDGYLSSIGYIL